jgi:fucose 4-O-acetylase-like acetyltransferase
MSDQIAWPRYLAMCVAGTLMIFVGALGPFSTTIVVLVVTVGSAIAALGWCLWVTALVRKHGSTRVLLWAVVVCVIAAIVGQAIQRSVEQRDQDATSAHHNVAGNEGLLS